MFDVAVIGGGVVGCAVARRFALGGARTVLLEKGADILSGASKGNSAILHTGFDAPPDSLELRCMQAGYAEYLRIRDSLRLPLLETGAIVAAWSEEEAARLPAILAQAVQNGVTDTRLLTRAEILEREPNLAETVQAGVLVPGEHLIDPWTAPLAYALQAIANGAEVRRNCELLIGAFDGAWALHTSAGNISAKTVINAAGLFGDVVSERLGAAPDFTIKPRKGQFVVFDKPASRLLHSILLPVPSERTKGIVLTRTVFGNLLVGPTAEEQESRTSAATGTATLHTLIATAESRLPGLKGMGVNAAYAGIRPATEQKHYRVSQDAARNLITLGGIRSTGLTAALGLAQHAWALYGGAPDEPETPALPANIPQLAEHGPRDWQAPGYGEIICHCEMVTRREIEAALTGPLAAHDSAALKRRTRAGMGRCQGFTCTHKLTELLTNA
jgi:glycerol-3-phosphate dehydrogenase